MATLVPARSTVEEVAKRTLNEERYDATSVGRLIFSNTAPAPPPPEVGALDLRPIDPAVEEGLCGECGVALRYGIGNPKCPACYKPNSRPVGTYESGAARWGVANAGGVTPRTQTRQLQEDWGSGATTESGGTHKVAGVDIDDANRWKKHMRRRAKNGGTVEKAGVRGTGEGVAKRVKKLSTRLGEVEQIKKKREESAPISAEERLKLDREESLASELGEAQKLEADKYRGWSAPRGAPYAPLGESPAMHGAGVWQSRPGPLRKNRYPVDILDDGRRQRDQAAAAVQAQMLTATLTKSKTQKPVESAKSSPRQVPLPPPVAELKQQLAYGDMRLRAARAGMDVASHMVDGTDFTPLSPRISGAPLTARELSRPGVATQSSGFPASWSKGQHSFFSSRSMASTARTWGTTTAEIGTAATCRRKSRVDPKQSTADFLFPSQPPARKPLPPPGSPRRRPRKKGGGSSSGGGGSGSGGGGGGGGGGGIGGKITSQQSVMRDLAVMAEHTFLEPSQQLQAKCTGFREKQQEMDDRFQRSLAQLEQHRSDNYRSKLKATLLLKDYKLTTKQPLKKELEFMGLMAQRDRTVRRLNAVRSATWLAPMMQVVSQHPRPRNLSTPETYVLDLLQTKINEGTVLDTEALFEIFDMLEMQELKDPRVLQIMEYARIKTGVPYDEFSIYLEQAGVTAGDDGQSGDGGGAGHHVKTREGIWLAELEQQRVQREAREEAAHVTSEGAGSPSRGGAESPASSEGGAAPSGGGGGGGGGAAGGGGGARNRRRKHGPGHRPNPLDALFEADTDLKDVFENPASLLD